MPQKLSEGESTAVISPLIDMMMNGLAVFFLIFVLSDNIFVRQIEFVDAGINPVTSDLRYYKFAYSVKNLGKDGRFELRQGRAALDSIGLSFDEATGEISGSVTGITQEMAIPITVVATEGDRSATKEDILKVYPVCYPSPNAPLEIVNENLEFPAGRANRAYRHQIGAKGGSGKYAWKAKGLPQGLQLDPTEGLIHGTPLEFGNFVVEVQLTNPEDTIIHSDLTRDSNSLKVGLEILSANITAELFLPVARIGEPYQGMLQVDRLLPDEVVIWDMSAARGSGLVGQDLTLTGTPVRAGSFRVSARIESAGDTILIRRGSVESLYPRPEPKIGRVTYSAEAGREFSFDLPYQGMEEPVEFSLEPGFRPDGTDKPIDSLLWVKDSRITGNLPKPGLYEIPLRAVPAAGQAVTGAVRVQITEETLPLELILPGEIVAVTGEEFQFAPAARGGTGNYEWQIRPGENPAQLSLDADALKRGLIKGRFSDRGKAVLDITLRDAGNNSLPSRSAKLTVRSVEQKSYRNWLIGLSALSLVLLLLVIWKWFFAKR